MSLRITGGARLSGTVAVAGSKNTVLALMAAAMLMEGESRLEGVPRISDIELFRQILDDVGVSSEWDGPLSLVIRGGRLLDCAPSLQRARQMRASYYVMGPLLARLGRASVGLPGGCSIGARPMDLHFRAFEALGARTRVDSGLAIAEGWPLRGSAMDLNGRFGSSVGATINALLAATVTPGLTRIQSAAQEPEVWEVAAMLNRAGARITGAGTRIIEVEGVSRLSPVTWQVPGDRIEAGTYLLAGAATGGDVTVTGVTPWMLNGLPELMERMGCLVMVGEERVRVIAPDRLEPVEAQTGTFPALATDLQPLLVAALCRANGVSMVGERVFDGRFEYARELERMGAHIRVAGSTAVITGVERLVGAPVAGPDLRGSAAIILAALAAEGESMVDGLQHLDRGYQDLDAKLRALGAQIRREREPAAVRSAT